MQEPPADDKDRKPKPSMPALPAQLGQKLRTLFADVEAQPAPDRLVELLEALATREKKV
jgi:Anti-sigma factor NepR